MWQNITYLYGTGTGYLSLLKQNAHERVYLSQVLRCRSKDFFLEQELVKMDPHQQKSNLQLQNIKFLNFLCSCLLKSELEESETVVF